MWSKTANNYIFEADQLSGTLVFIIDKCPPIDVKFCQQIKLEVIFDFPTSLSIDYSNSKDEKRWKWSHEKESSLQLSSLNVCSSKDEGGNVSVKNCDKSISSDCIENYGKSINNDCVIQGSACSSLTDPKTDHTKDRDTLIFKDKSSNGIESSSNVCTTHRKNGAETCENERELCIKICDVDDSLNICSDEDLEVESHGLKDGLDSSTANIIECDETKGCNKIEMYEINQVNIEFDKNCVELVQKDECGVSMSTLRSFTKLKKEKGKRICQSKRRQKSKSVSFLQTVPRRERHGCRSLKKNRNIDCAIEEFKNSLISCSKDHFKEAKISKMNTKISSGEHDEGTGKTNDADICEFDDTKLKTEIDYETFINSLSLEVNANYHNGESNCKSKKSRTKGKSSSVLSGKRSLEKTLVVENCSDKDVKCKYCCKLFKTKSDFYNHRRCKGSVFTCSQCGKKESFEALLIVHMQSHKPHKGLLKDDSEKDKMSSQKAMKRKLKMKCDVCGLVVSSSDSLKIHAFTHTGEKPYKCCVCSDNCFCSLTSLQYHLESHLSVCHFQCKRCDVKFSSRTELARHQLTHEIKCDLCGEIFPNKTSRNYHFRTAHTNDALKCTQCSSMFGSESDLQRHMLYHNKTGKKEQCPICGLVVVKLKNHMTQHMHRDGEKIMFPCPECPRKYRSKSSLNKHLNTHTRERSYACNKCSKTFTAHGMLSRHLLTHSTERKYTCGICGKAFSMKFNLVVHMRRHTNLRPHNCPLCPQAFNYKNSLKVHIKAKHSQGSHQIQCPKCSLTFQDINLIVTHMYEEHGSKELNLQCHAQTKGPLLTEQVDKIEEINPQPTLSQAEVFLKKQKLKQTEEVNLAPIMNNMSSHLPPEAVVTSQNAISNRLSTEAVVTSFNVISNSYHIPSKHLTPEVSSHLQHATKTSFPLTSTSAYPMPIDDIHYGHSHKSFDSNTILDGAKPFIFTSASGIPTTYINSSHAICSFTNSSSTCNSYVKNSRKVYPLGSNTLTSLTYGHSQTVLMLNNSTHSTASISTPSTETKAMCPTNSHLNSSFEFSSLTKSCEMTPAKATLFSACGNVSTILKPSVTISSDFLTDPAALKPKYTDFTD